MSAAIERTRNLLHKLSWGVRTVGLLPTMRGAVRLAWVWCRRPATVDIRLRSGGVLTADVPGQVVPALLLFGDPIDPEYEFLRHIVRDDSVVVDVGAAIGQFTVCSARLGPQVVHACEPSDANLDTLRRNIQRNHVDGRVTVHRVALSDCTGEAAFATAPTTYLSRLDRPAADDRAATSGTVPVRRLDTLVDEWGLTHIDVLKVNVAGFEPEVLSGADSLFATGRVDVVIALVGGASRPHYERMASLGYRFFFFHPRQMALHEVHRFDDRFLVERPWPARHVIAVLGSAVEQGRLGSIGIVGDQSRPPSGRRPGPKLVRAHPGAL